MAEIQFCDLCGRVYIEKKNDHVNPNLKSCHVCYNKLGILFRDIVEFIEMNKLDKSVYLNDKKGSIALFTLSYISTSLGVDSSFTMLAINEFFDYKRAKKDDAIIKALVRKVYSVDKSLDLIISERFIDKEGRF